MTQSRFPTRAFRCHRLLFLCLAAILLGSLAASNTTDPTYSLVSATEFEDCCVQQTDSYAVTSASKVIGAANTPQTAATYSVEPVLLAKNTPDVTSVAAAWCFYE